jgi:uroporphyrinogen decarboxylase
MRKQERLEHIIAGEKPDRIPVALWRHWPGDDQRYADLARSIIDFQHDYNWDFVRIMPSTNFQVVDYGIHDEWHGNLHGTREISKHIIKRSLEWTEIRSLTPDRGMLGQQVECTRLVCSAMEAEGTPVLQTIYSPFAQAARLGGKDLTLRNMRTHPDRLRTGLNILTESTLRFIEALWRIPNIAGVFLVTEFANYDMMSEEEYMSFAMPYNLKILESLLERWWFNIVQIQGKSPMVSLFKDIPAQVLNWDTRTGHPDLSRARGLFPKTICGGLSDWKDLHQGTPSSIQDAVRQAFQETQASKFILGNSGSGYVTMPIANIRAVRSIVESIAI